jgi:hypothetical protein
MTAPIPIRRVAQNKVWKRGCFARRSGQAKSQEYGVCGSTLARMAGRHLQARANSPISHSAQPAHTT